MEDKNNNFEEQWKKAFDDAEEQPDGMLWQNIESKLAQSDIGFYKKKYFYAQVSAAVLLLLLLPLSGYFIYHFRNQSLVNNTSVINTNSKESIVFESIDASDSAYSKVKNSKGSSATIASNNTKESGTKAQSNTLDKEGESSSSNETLDKDQFGISFEDNAVAKIKSGEGSVAKRDSETKAINNLHTSEKVALNNKSLDGQHLDKSNTTNFKTPHSDEPYSLNENLAKADISNNNTATDKSSKLISSTKGAEDGSSGNEGVMNLPGPSQSTELLAKNSEYVGNTVSTGNSALINPIVSRSAVINEVKPKQIYLYFWQNESMYIVQNEVKKDDKNKIRRWYANLDFIPSYTNQNFESASNANTMANDQSDAFFSTAARTTLDQSTKELAMLSKPEFSFTSGLNGAYRINSKLSIEVGLKYVYSQAKVFTNNYFEDQASNTQYPAFNLVLKDASAEQVSNANYQQGFVNNNQAPAYSSFNTVSAVNNAKSPSTIDNYKNVSIYTQYIGVPLTLNYKIIDKRLDISLGGGISTDFFLQYGSKDSKGDGFESETITRAESGVFKPYTFSFLITPEIEYGLSSRSSIYFRPMYKGALQSFTDQQKLSNKPNSTGVGFGVRYNFR